jgi:hypothetical protein
LAKVAARRRVKLSEGDVFELTLPDGRLGYGIIVKRGTLKSGGTPYIALFRSVHEERPDPAGLVDDEVALAGWTTDALVCHERWNVVAHNFPQPLIPFPNFKVEMSGKFYVTDVEGIVIDEVTAAERELLDFQFSHSPLIFQDAFEARHGLGEWHGSYEKLTPAYAQSRVTRPSR